MPGMGMPPGMDPMGMGMPPGMMPPGMIPPGMDDMLLPGMMPPIDPSLTNSLFNVHLHGPPGDPPKEEEPKTIPVSEEISAKAQLYNNLRIRPAGPWLPKIVRDSALRFILGEGGHSFIGSVAKHIRVPADLLTTHFCVQGPFLVLRPDELYDAKMLPPPRPEDDPMGGMGLPGEEHTGPRPEPMVAPPPSL